MEILCDDHFVVAASTASQWATRKKIALKDLMKEDPLLVHEILEGDFLAGCPLTSGAGGDDEMVIAQDLHIHIIMCERLQEPTPALHRRYARGARGSPARPSAFRQHEPQYEDTDAWYAL